MKKVKALLIDPFQRKVNAIEFEPTLENFYQLIGCNCIAGFTDSSGASFTYDDEYLITGGRELAYCIMDDWDYPMGGRLIATGAPDEEGECTGLTEAQARDICQRLHWVELVPK
ncbi:MAG: hypothetical protein KDD27_07935 [Saprospiraceae bacterium]|nr:hypothetical protein [Saprospiraceae bacterium]